MTFRLKQLTQVFLVAAGLVWNAPVSGQGGGLPPVRHYGSEDGLSSDMANAMVQDRQGLIWAGTEAGLDCFDGRRFNLYTGALPSLVVTDLYADPDGSLWVATDGGLCHIQDGVSRVFGPEDGIPATAMRKVGRDATGRLWALGADALWVLGVGDVFQKAPPFGASAQVIQMFVHATVPGAMALLATGIQQWQDGAWHAVALPPRAQGEAPLNLSVDGEGNLWVRTSRGFWRKPSAGPWRLEKLSLSGGYSFASRMDRDAQGYIWTDDGEHLLRLRGAQQQICRAAGIEPRGGMLDREGGLWYRMSHGIGKDLGMGRWTQFTVQDGLPASQVWQPLRDKAGRLWVATEKGLCVSRPKGPGFQLVLPGRILSLALAPDGGVWAVGSPGGTVWRVDPATLNVQAIPVPVLPRSRISQGIAVDLEGTPWVADHTAGLARGVRKGKDWTWTKVSVAGQDAVEILGLEALPMGGILVLQSRGASLYRLARWESIPDVLAEGPSSVACNPDGKLAIGYRNHPFITLHRVLPDRVQRTAVVDIRQDGRNLVTVFSMGLDPQGRVWVGTSSGLGRLTGEDARSFQMLGTEDRMVSPECNDWSMFVEAGRTLVGTTSGLMAYDSGLPELPDALGLPVILSLDPGTPARSDLETLPTLPRAHNLLALNFMIPTYQAPARVLCQARLEGADPDWVEVKDGQLRYAGLAAGSYTLHLRGLLASGQPGPTRTLSFRVAPAWFQTLWAQALGLMALVGALWGIVRLRGYTLAQRNLQLQREVARQTQALSEASQAKSDFLATMSHEIRTPMNAVIGMTQLALQTTLTSQQRDYLVKTKSAADSLLGIINDILDFSKIEAGKLAMGSEAFLVEEVFHRTLQVIGGKAAEKGLAITLEMSPEVPPSLIGDPHRLGQVLTNLCSNAVKFTESGADIFVTISRVPYAADRVTLLFSVKDSGIGMTAEQTKDLFQPFMQVDSSSSRRFGGTGLGLAICKHLVEMMGGRIWVESRAEEGSEFFFTATFATDPDHAQPEGAARRILGRMDREPAHPETPAQVRGSRVLLVEDNDFNRQVAKEFLAMMGVEVTLAIHGREALDLIRAQPFDAVLMDLQMPVMNGYEATAEIRRDPRFVTLPILAFTAHAFLQERERCLAIGMNDFITKPIQPEDLLATLAKWVQVSQPPAGPVPAGLPELPGITPGEGLAFATGNTDFQAGLLRKFMNVKAASADELRAALSGGDLEAVATLAHAMISTAGTIGAMDLCRSARALQEALRSGQPETYHPALEAYELDLAIVIKGLKTHFKNI